MPSNISSFEMKLSRHFTAIELVEFLGIDVDDIIDKFGDVIEDNLEELLEEIE